MAIKVQTSRSLPSDKQREVLCQNLSFAGAEAFKKLRNSVAYSLPGDQESRIIAVTSADVGEGKTTTSINLAHSIAATGDKVLLIEGDMRLPNIGNRLEIKSGPGLSDLLVGKADTSEVIQLVPVKDKFFCITAGSLPPNPSELLTSSKLEHFFKVFKNTFDYIIVDLPPVNVVVDASSLAKHMDGYIVVVRQDKSTLRAIAEAMENLRIVDGKVLGFVLNDVKLSSGRYSRKYGYNYNYEYHK